jgi:hypothetical protein
MTPATPLVRFRPGGWPPAGHGHRGKRILRAGRWQGLDASSNVFVIRAVGPGRTIAHNEAKAHRLLSTLIEACASKRRGLAISNEGAIRCVTIVSTL